MECFLFFIVMLITLTVILSLGSRSQWRTSRRNALFRQLANKFHGTCRAGNWFSPPNTQFRYGEGLSSVSMVTNRRAGGAVETQVYFWFRWPEREFRCEVTSLTPGSVELETDLPGISVDGDDFDRDFRARTNDEPTSRRLLSEGVQWQLQRVLDGDHGDPVRMSIDDNKLFVSRQTEFTNCENLERFVRLAMDLHDQLMLTTSAGIEFVESDEAQIVQEARCQVCGDEIHGDMVFCRRCKTPHHQECWHYYGSCSTYGCREQHYHVPRVAQPAPASEEPTTNDENGSAGH